MKAKPLKYGFIYLFLLIMCFTINSFSQTSETYQDTTINLNDTTKQKEIKSKLTKSPVGAIWRSLALPGLGQYYVESYWKAPIFFLGAAGLYTAIFWNNSEYQKEADYLTTLSKSHPDYNITKLRREYFRDNRDQSAFYLLVVYIFAAVDAYTGAHLYDFNVDDNFSFNYQFSKEGFMMVGFKINF